MSDFGRRSFVAGLGAAVGTAMMSSGRLEATEQAIVTHSPQSTPRPNIIIMICDDLGSGDLGCYGSNLHTPNLNRMAEEGARLTRYNTPHPICSASRAALLTGRYSTRTATQPVYFPQSTDGLALDEMTLANVLHERQYRSMCIGKWHLGSKPEYLPTSRGFDSYFGVPYSVDMQPLPLIRDNKVIEENANRALLTPQYTEEAVRFIESPSRDPFFLYLAYSYPHIPIDASPRFKGKSGKGIYGDAVEEIDWSVGQILASLERKGLDENTLVIFTSDHGPWFQGSPGSLRGRKGTTYEGGCRVPFLARWKTVIPVGKVLDCCATHLDLMPTVASVCRAALPSKPLDGVNIIDALTGRANSVDHPSILYFSPMKGGRDLQCIRQDHFKLRISQYTRNTYVLGDNPGENLMLDQPELYDIADDLGESYDIAANRPELVRYLLREIEKQIPTFPAEVVNCYNDLKTKRASPTTPAASAARPGTYHSGPYHYNGNPN